MKSIMVFTAIIGIILAAPVMASAGDCHTDRVVKRWLEDRDRAEERVVQMWARGASPDDFASDVAVILSNEFYICSKCRENSGFLEQNLHLLNSGSAPKIEAVPAILLERLIGSVILSPWRQFPSEKRKGVAKAW